MNIYVQICGIILLLFIMIMSFIRRSVWLKTRKFYIVTLLLNIICLALDAASVVAIYTEEGSEVLHAVIICKVYLVSLIITAYTTFLYITVELEESSRHTLAKQIVGSIMVVLMAAGVFLLPIELVYHNPYCLYSEGPAVFYTYTCTGLFLAVALSILLYHKKDMSLRRWTAGIVWIVLWIIGAVVQLFFKDLLIVGYCAALGVLVVFIRLENPEVFVDKVTGYFNEAGFRALLNQVYKEKRKIYMISIYILNSHYIYERFDSEKVNLILRNMAIKLGNLKYTKLYRINEMEFCLVYDFWEDMDKAVEQLKIHMNDRIDVKKEEVLPDCALTLIPEYDIANDAEELLNMLRAFHKDYEFDPDRIFTLDRIWAVRYRRERAVERTIVDAMEDDRIEVFYQPIYSIEKKRFVSAEALVRIREKNGDYLQPGDFIPVAEETGLVLDLGMIIFEKACEFIVKSDLKSKGIDYLEINLSAVQCTRSGLVRELTSVIEKTGVEPSMLNLEITESAAIKSKDTLTLHMNKLREMGIHFSLDDFGTGYSNLEYILDLPLTIVKFDRKMTQAYFEDERKNVIMQSIVDMIKAINLEIVVEGVDKKEQLDALTEINVDFVQGYYFSKPVPANGFLKLLEGQNR